MLRIFIVLSFLSFLFLPVFCVADDTEEILKNFLKSREVVGQVYFETSSSLLTQFSQHQLDRLVTRLKDLGNNKILFRIEGFASPDGNHADNVNLSMNRAMTVRNFLRNRHDLELEIFVTGFGGIENSSGSPEKSRRVDIAMYQRPAATAALFDDLGTVEKIVTK